MSIIKFNPVFKQMIWGGNRLRDDFNYKLDMENIGECWGISAHENGDCTISNGEYKGMKLSQLFASHKELFGNIESEKFPLLIKIIDAKADLSIQVHPDDIYAKEHENGSYGKTECWYILDAEEGAEIVIGHHAKNHEEVQKMIEEKHWDEFIRKIPVKKGDFFQINPGTVHAIKGGTLILETQQNSDITYRVYDYDRLQNGKPRQLHINQSIDVIIAPYVDEKPYVDHTITINKDEISDSVSDEQNAGMNLVQMVSCDYYTVWKAEVLKKGSLCMDQPFMLVSVIEGEGNVNGEEVKKGDHFLISSKTKMVDFSGDIKLIISSPKIKHS